ncbi:hypothetical protein ONA70_02260 [Micromonospora yasonensis]|uniref:hypothetical protein n=1 Tax=Micromonospora yasonensis TaxID=1128667 RepID=UPI0022319A45|nr:hypothetical protein [Micromonospora yasonensis]MCW3838919.1 hypothetical protein [Micromonospora yasonensis]
MKTGIGLKLTAGFVLLAGAVLIAPAPAYAATATNSIGYASDFNSGNDEQACKTVNTSRKIYGQFTRRNGSSGETGHDANYTQCATSPYYTGGSKIYRIRVCEDISFQPDPCSAWVNTGY